MGFSHDPHIDYVTYLCTHVHSDDAIFCEISSALNKTNLCEIRENIQYANY